MIRTVKKLALAAAGGSLLGAAVWGLQGTGYSDAFVPEAQAAQPPAPVAAAVPGNHKFVGVSSCAAASCHGGDGSGPTWQSSYSIWAQKDRHADAYIVLLNEESQLIAKNLNLPKPAHESKECLVCHATATDQSQMADAHPFEVTDGVSCEGCHGAAEHWLVPHIRADWPKKPAAEKAALGFIETEELHGRAKACAVCHVGSAGRDVNHDLIAAGHPRLNFEFGAYLANMANHWNRADDRQRNQPSLEARAWAVGQVAVAEAAIELLEHRVKTQSPAWPEFAEYSCFACHHDLQAPSWRQSSAETGFGTSKYSWDITRRRPGQYPWGTWYFPLIPALTAEISGNGSAGTMAASLQALQDEMGRPAPRANIVLERTADVRNQLAALRLRVDSTAWTTERSAALLKHLSGDGELLADRDWDAAAQVYLATAGLHVGYREANGERGGETTAANEAIRKSLEGIRALLEFPVDPVLFESPRDFEPGQRKAAYQTLRDQVNQLR